MLGKLLKYDMKSMFRVFVPLWLALLAVSLINHFTVDFRGNAIIGAIPTVIFMILYVCLIVAVMVVTVALVILRFYNGLLKDEGYLMFTLPVRPWQLVISKCITATVVVFISFAAAFLSLCIITLNVSAVPDFFQWLVRAIPHVTGEMTATLVLTLLLILASILASIMHVYASLALGHLAPSHRVGWAILAFIGTNVVLSVAGVFLGNLADYYNWSVKFELSSRLAAANLVLGVLLLLCVLEIVLFFVITERILSKRLNLE